MGAPFPWRERLWGFRQVGLLPPPILRKNEGLGHFLSPVRSLLLLLCEVWDPLATDASVGIFWGWRGEEGVG